MSSERLEISSAPMTPRPAAVVPKPASPPVACPPTQYNSPSLSRAPLLNIPETTAPGEVVQVDGTTPTTNESNTHTPRFMSTPLASPLWKEALKLTIFNRHDAWLPISRIPSERAYYATFHALCSGICQQALILPFAFTNLGWAWGIIFLALTSIWQLYTLQLFVELYKWTGGGRNLRSILYPDRQEFSRGEKLTKILVIITICSNIVTTFQIYAMAMFDHIESQYEARFKKPCTWWLSAIIRAMFGLGCFFFAVAIPFLGSLAGLIGGIALPVTLAYPCFMWLKIMKPKKNSIIMWMVNWILGVLGMGLSTVLIAIGIYMIINTGITWAFFKPHYEVEIFR